MIATLFLLLACSEAQEAPLVGAAPGATEKAAEPDASSADEEAAALEHVEAATERFERHEKEGTDPEKALAIWMEGAILASSGDLKSESNGIAVLTKLTIPFKKDGNWMERPSNATFVERLESHPHIFRSYAKGATPENGYAADVDDFELNVAKTDDGDDRGMRVFIQSGGADSARPVYMKKSTKTGLYYVNNFNNVYVDIRPVVDPDEETFE